MKFLKKKKKLKMKKMSFSYFLPFLLFFSVSREGISLTKSDKKLYLESASIIFFLKM